MYDSHGISFTMLYDHRLYQNIFIISKGNPMPISFCPPRPPAHPRSWLPVTYPLSLWIGLFWIFNINGIIQHMTFGVCLLFTQYTFFKVPPCCSIYQHLIPLPGWTVFHHSMDTPHFVYPFISWMTPALFPSFENCEWCCYEYLASCCIK